MNSKNTIQPGWISTPELCFSLGISTRAFHHWGVEPVGKVGRTNYFLMADVLENRSVRWGGSTDPDTEARKIEYQQARTRLINEQADAQEMKNEITRHETAPFGFLTYTNSKAANAIKGVMDALPVECMRQLNLNTKEVEKIREIVARSSNSIADLGNVEWMEQVFDEYLEQEGLS